MGPPSGSPLILGSTAQQEISHEVGDDIIENSATAQSAFSKKVMIATAMVLIGIGGDRIAG